MASPAALRLPRSRSAFSFSRAWVVAVALAALFGAPARAAEPGDLLGDPRRLPDRVLRTWAKLLRVEDARRRPAEVLPLLRDLEARSRALAVRTLGRLADPTARTHLEGVLASDPDPRVRAEAAGALGLLGDAAAGPALARALDDVAAAIPAARALGLLQAEEQAPALASRARAPGRPAALREAAFLALAAMPQAPAARAAVPARPPGDPVVRRAAAYLVARLEADDVPTLGPAWRAQRDPVVRARLLRALRRKPPEDWKLLARVLPDAAELGALGPTSDPEVRALASSAAATLGALLGGPHSARAAGLLRALLASRLSHVRLAALRAVASADLGGRIAGVRALLTRAIEDAAGDLSVIAPPAAEGAARRGAGSPPVATGSPPVATGAPARAAIAGAARPGTGQATAPPSPAWLPARGGAGALQAAALRALLHLDPGRAPGLAPAALATGDPRVRAALAEAVLATAPAGAAPFDRLRQRLLADPDRRVRLAALEGLARREASPEVDARLREALDDAEPPIVMTAAQALARREAPDLAEPVAAALRRIPPRHHEERAVLLEILVAAKDAARLEAFRRDPDRLLRAKVRQALGLPPPRGSAPEVADEGFYLTQLRRYPRHPRVRMRTARGELVLELDVAAAPLNCWNLLALAGNGFFDGLSVHRVVPGFVAQTGDPRGDGYGGPGYLVRCERSLARYRRGTLGMALAGRDTGGSQFFVSYQDFPHLEGGYTVLGQVVEGLEVAEALLPGDTLLEVTVDTASLAGDGETRR